MKYLMMTTLVAAMALFGPLAAAEESGPLAEGAISQVSGQAMILGLAGKSRPAKVGDILRGGEVIETRAETKVRVILVDKSVLELRSNSRVQINDSRLNPRSVSSVLVYAGWIWAKVTARAGPDFAFEVETPTNVAGVRGTELEVAVAEDGSSRVGVIEGRAVMGNQAGSLNLRGGENGEAGYESAPVSQGSYSSTAEFWLSFLAKHQLLILTQSEVFVVRMVAAILDARAKLIERDREFREGYEDFHKRHPAVAEKEPEPEPEKKPEPKPKPEAVKEEAATASEVRGLYLKARETQKEANRLESNYYLAEQAQAAVSRHPEKFTPAQTQAINAGLAQVRDIPQLQLQSRQALNGFAVVLEAQVNRFSLAPTLGRPLPLDRNLQIQQILKQIPGALPPMPGPQTFPKPVMPKAPMPRLP